MGERVLLELSWQAWHCANFAQTVSGHMMPIKTEHPCWQVSSGAGERLPRQGHGGDPPGAQLFLGLFLRVGKLAPHSLMSGAFSGL